MKIRHILFGMALFILILNITAFQAKTYAGFDSFDLNHSIKSLQETETPPTKAPRPTSTPIPTPPPANPGTTNLMVFFSTLIIVIILIGVWLNRRKVP